MLWHSQQQDNSIIGIGVDARGPGTGSSPASLLYVCVAKGQTSLSTNCYNFDILMSLADCRNG